MAPDRQAVIRAAAGARARTHRLKPAVLAGLLLACAAATAVAQEASPAAEGAKPRLQNRLVTARELLSQRRWAEAEAELRRLVDANRQDPDAHVMLGIALKRTGKIKEAAAALEQAVQLQPRHRPAREALGNIYLLGREPEKAAAQLDFLKQICAGSCPEYHSLSNAIAGYSP